MNQDRIVATIVYSPSTRKSTTLEGDQTKEVSDDNNWMVVTEAQLLTMNSFVRKRWEKAFTDIPKTQYPLTPDQCYEGPRTDH